jgi:uncharacterized repeat protein (TIGR03847 family)
MPSVVHSFDPPERFVAGTVGEPGSRTFFLQARSGRQLVSVSLEKQQVALLAERVDELLDEVMALANGVVPAVAPFELDDNKPLDQPIEEEFRAGTMTLSWDPGDERVVIEVYPVEESVTVVSETPEGEEQIEVEEPEPEEVLLVRITPGQARAFAKRAQQVVSAGRPDCPFCGGPIDPAGHLCPRANGFKRRDP